MQMKKDLDQQNLDEQKNIAKRKADKNEIAR